MLSFDAVLLKQKKISNKGTTLYKRSEQMDKHRHAGIPNMASHIERFLSLLWRNFYAQQPNSKYNAESMKQWLRQWERLSFETICQGECNAIESQRHWRRGARRREVLLEYGCQTCISIIISFRCLSPYAHSLWLGLERGIFCAFFMVPIVIVRAF